MSTRHILGLAGALLAGLLATRVDAQEPEPRAVLALQAGFRAYDERPLRVPVLFAYFETTVTAAVFSIDLDERLSFDPTDADMDGIPDAVTLPSGTPSVTFIDYDPGDTDGEIDVMLTNLSGAPLPQGTLLRFTFQSRETGWAGDWLSFSTDPPASFGDAQGNSVEGITMVFGGSAIFADGFEDGTFRAWSKVRR